MGKTSKRDIALQELKATQQCELLDFLIQMQVRKSRNAVKSLLAHKQIKVNGKMITQYDYELKAGDKVSVMKFDQSRKEKRLKGLKIVFEDDDLIVVDKEAGFLTVSTDKEKLRTVYGMLTEYVQKGTRGQRGDKNARVFVVHRLDREVSGLLVFARTPELQEMFQKHWDNLVKVYTYTAVVNGKPEPKDGTIISWLTENKNFVMLSALYDNGGLRSVTHYKQIKTTDRFTLLDFDLETRRKNQIRVQMKNIGHPIVGDKKYGATTNPIKRIALHAREMVIKHPTTGELLEFRSSLPKLMQQLLVLPEKKKGAKTEEEKLD